MDPLANSPVGDLRNSAVAAVTRCRGAAYPWHRAAASSRPASEAGRRDQGLAGRKWGLLAAVYRPVKKRRPWKNTRVNCCACAER
eukprot:5339197-Alexandrium_andersonii.AAC.1